MLVAELLQRAKRSRVTTVVNRADCLGARANAGGHVLGVEPEVLLTGDLGQDRGAAAITNRGGRGDEGDAGHDHLVAGADSGGQVGEVQSRGATADGHRVLDPEMLGELRLELLDPRPHRQPTGAQGGGDGLDVALVQADVEDGDRIGR